MKCRGRLPLLTSGWTLDHWPHNVQTVHGSFIQLRVTRSIHNRHPLYLSAYYTVNIDINIEMKRAASATGVRRWKSRNWYRSLQASS